MELWQYNACYKGYEDRNKDALAIAIHGGFYAAYYALDKHPTALSKVLSDIYKPEKPEPVDVDAFLRKEARMEAWHKQ